MPKLERSQWYDLSRDMNWRFKYTTEAEVFPEALSQSHGIPAAAWWEWDEPYKISYREYVHNQAGKDAGVYSVRSAIAMPEYLASIGEARMGRWFGRAAAWRNMALYGTALRGRGGSSPQAGTPRSSTQGRTLGLATEGQAMMSVSLLGN